MSGCGSNSIPVEPVNAKSLDINKIKKQYPDINITHEEINKGNILYSSANGDYSMLSMIKQNNHNIVGIQKAALDTINTNQKYFEVIMPKTLAEKKLSTYKQFSEECLSSNPLGGGDPCDITNSSFFSRTSGIVGHLLDNKATANLLIKTYTEKPSNINVFDAKKVLESLKKENSLQENAGEYK
ncbi:hypothetical protein [Poseidonibacter sp.]|uniref:hypothetical protein n=1 Tax=Poseidonibacter sp. TaxID=2321188 RepID=UPI003C72D4CB